MERSVFATGRRRVFLEREEGMRATESILDIELNIFESPHKYP